MAYLDGVAVLDCETTGVNPLKCAVLSVGIVAFGERPTFFYREYYPFEGAQVEEMALRINGFDLSAMKREEENDPRNIPDDVESFMRANGCAIVAGENPSFDRDFVNAYAERYGKRFRLQRRTMDLNSVCLSHMFGSGMSMPRGPNGSYSFRLDDILSFAGLGTEPAPHNALTGAKYEFEALCRLIYGKSVLPEFSAAPVPEGLVLDRV